MSDTRAQFWGHELRAVDAILNDVDRAGVVIVGGPGAGKSSLVQAVMQDGGHLASLSLQCSAALADVAYGALSPFLAELDDIRGPIDVLRAMQCRLDGQSRPGPTDGTPVGSRTHQRPVIVVEDCQFLDAASAFVLAQLGQNREAALLATSVGLLRGESGLAALVDTGLLATVTMPPLGTRQVRSMCESLVGGSPTEGAASTIHGMTGGSPRLVAAFLASAVDQGMVAYGPDVRPVHQGAPGPWTLQRLAPSIDGRLVDAVEGMHAELTDEQQVAVTMLALAGRMPRSLLRALAGDHGQDLAEVHVTRFTTDGMVELTSALYAEVLRSTVPPGRSSTLLEQWQAAGGAALRPPPGRSVVWTIENGLAVPEQDRVAAGYEFLAAGDLAAAWALASRDAEPGGPRHLLFRAEVMLAAARTWSGRGDLVELADSLIDEHMLAEVLAVLAMDLVRCGELASPWQALRQVRSDYLDRALRQGRAALLTTGPLARLLDAADPPEDVSEGPDLLDLSADLLAGPGAHPAVRSIVHWLRMQLLARAGQLVGAAREADLAYAEAFRTPRLIASMGEHAVVHRVMSQLLVGDPDQAQRVLDDQRDGAIPRAHAWAGTVQALRAVVELFRGHRAPAVHVLRHAVVDLGQADPVQLMPLVQALHDLITAQDGAGPGSAGESAVDRLRAIRPRGPRDRWLLASAVASLADESRHTASTDETPLWRRVLDDPVLDNWPVVRRELLVIVAFSRDPADDHDELLTRLHHACVPLDGRRSSLLRKACDPALASDATRLVRVADEARAAGDLPLAADVWARVVMLHHQGSDLRRRGEALRHLQDVVQVLGGVPTRYVDGALGLGALTEREHEIVRLALEGRTNADIAKALVVSPRTVEGHLYRVFTKLGISDRAELRGLRL